MINYNNNDIKEMHYSGYTIIRAYGCNGELVFGEEPPTPVFDFKSKIVDNSGNTYTVECNSSTTLTTYEEHMATGGINNSAYTSIEIGNCVTTLEDQLFQVTNVNENHGATSITLSNSVTTIGNNVFEGNPITSIYLPTGVTSIGIGTFMHCSHLTSIDIPTGITQIPVSAFQYCSGLTAVSLHSGITSIGQYAFSNCKGLQSVTINALAVPTLGIGAFSFSDSTATYPIYVPAESLQAYKTASIWSNYSDRIKPIIIPKLLGILNNGTTIPIECDSASTVGIRDVVNLEMEIINQGLSFENDLVSLNIGNCVTSIGDSSFSDFKNMSSVTISDSVTTIGEYAFNRCSGLTSINIPSGVTTIGEFAFEHCSGLTGITINATVPPTLEGYFMFESTNNYPIFVPAESVEAYKNASIWKTEYASRIQPIPT